MKRNGSVLLFVLFFLMAMECSAQTATSFDQLQLLVKPGDSVYVTDFSGNTVKGRISQLTTTSFGLTVKGQRRDLLQTDVWQIQQWRNDSLKNGALIGLGVGAGLGTALGIACYAEGGSCGAATAVMILYGAGLGAGIGVGLDALIPAKQTIYQNYASNRTSGKFRVAPILNRKDKGIKVAFSF
jgi:hypothetical protein